MPQEAKLEAYSSWTAEEKQSLVRPTVNQLTEFYYRNIQDDQTVLHISSDLQKLLGYQKPEDKLL